MTDRELLELAAKAAGIPLRDLDDQWDNWEPEPVRIHRGWNPIEYDGDALRLAHTVPMIVTPGTARLLDGRLFGADNKDIAATRRAIVQAAAEIGKSMV